MLKMVSSSTGFIKGMMELSLAAAVPPSTVNNVNDGSTLLPETDRDDTTSQPRPSNGPSSTNSSAVGSGDKTASRRFGKGLTWLRGRRRRSGDPPASLGKKATRCWWRRRHERNNQSATTNFTTRICPTPPPNAIPTVSNADRTTVPDKNRSQTSLKNNGPQDAAVGGVFEKRATWLKRSSRITDFDDGYANVDDENSVSSDALSAEQLNVDICVISDGQRNAAVNSSIVNAGFMSTDLDHDANHSNAGPMEVVLNPAALATAKTSIVAGKQSLDCPTSVAVDYVPSLSVAHSQPRQSDTDYGVDVVASSRPGSLTLGSVGLPTDDEAQQGELSPLSSDVDFLCNEIGSLVADYMRQKLVFFNRHVMLVMRGRN